MLLRNSNRTRGMPAQSTNWRTNPEMGWTRTSTAFNPTHPSPRALSNATPTDRVFYMRLNQDGLQSGPALSAVQALSARGRATVERDSLLVGRAISAPVEAARTVYFGTDLSSSPDVDSFVLHEDRRKKCDEKSPICNECRRLGLVNCQLRQSASNASPGILVEQQEKKEEAYLSPQSPPSEININQDLEINVQDYLGHIAPIGISPEQQAEFDATERHLLIHYAQYVSRAFVVVNDDENPFLNEVLQLAKESKPVRHAMLALTACHLCKVYPMFEDTLILQHSLALHYLKLDLESGDGITCALVISLLLCLFCICRGDSPKWILHLYGAKALIDLHQDVSTAPSNFALDLYAIICCKTRITCDRVPVVSSSSSSFTSSRTEFMAAGIHPLFGLASCLYEKLDLISQLPLKRSQMLPDCVNFTLETRSIEKYLTEWSVPTNVRHQNTQLISDTAMAAEAIRWAALIRLYQIMVEETEQEKEDIEEKKQIAVDNLLNAISSIPPGSPADSQLLLPLFMAGLVTPRKSERLQIEYRLSIVENIVVLGNISCAHQLLDLVWERYYNGEVDWQALLRVEYPHVLLF
ncbi:hypothetical protein UA08_01590 [Talaromyces atroroseus]|uniref:Zn(2)-C6 fungal-type domain-containing protein n=1 Tax=Talaromyces atroroseus TaxID=1441469 RepID=A0A1Q5QBG5_TALAT|nr:hypothetical protein UA08_01590 [Talaromyces atroroseus]OKL63256.1 hypothetical protein UA08_01590 [Talaromyces atroroseus]